MRRAFNKRRMRREKGVEPLVTGDNIELKGKAVEGFKKETANIVNIFKRPNKAKPENQLC